MKKLLLSGIAALFLATGTAHAGTKLPPTDPLIGGWCRVSSADQDPSKGPVWYKRGSTCREFDIERDGFKYEEGGCEFIEIKRVPNGIEAIAECWGEGIFTREKQMLQIIGKKLRQETKTLEPVEAEQSPFCVRVEPTPDGFLNLREGPGMIYKPKAKLTIDSKLKIDANAKSGEWLHVYEDDGRSIGWVYNKYTRKIDCKTGQVEVEPSTVLTSKIPTIDVPSPSPKYDAFPASVIGDWCYAETDDGTAKYDRGECAGPNDISVRQQSYYGYTIDCRVGNLELYGNGNVYKVESRCQERFRSTWTEIANLPTFVGDRLSVRILEKK